MNKFPPSTQAFVMEIRKSRDNAMAELEKMKRERDEVRGKLKVRNIFSLYLTFVNFNSQFINLFNKINSPISFKIRKYLKTRKVNRNNYNN